MKRHCKLLHLLSRRSCISKIQHIFLDTILGLGLAILLAASQATSQAVGEGAVLVTKGQSAFSICREKSAPKSVHDAAAELQRVIELATGCLLPIRDEAAEPAIHVGDCAASRNAGLLGGALSEETFRIKTNHGSIFIVGHDTADGGITESGGVSRGTLFGVFEFLERVIGARWIMPGALGEIIPWRDGLVVPELDLSDGPSFASRQLELSDPPPVRQWALRNRIGTQPNDAGALVVDSGHTWNELMPADTRSRHPEWAAQHPYPEENNYKFCTRNREAVAFFTENLHSKLEQQERRRMASAAPSDGQSFCRCHLCAVYTGRDLNGGESTTRNLLEFYNEVAQTLTQKRPDQRIGALVYGVNAYPPREVISLNASLFIVWAPLDVYGLGLYKAEYKRQFEQIAAGWRALSANVGYSNYLHWHRSLGCAPLAPAPEIMKLEFAVLKRFGFRSVCEAVDSNWAYAGPNNWMLAKLMWHADSNIDELYEEWLKLAYAQGADAMRRLYSVIDNGFREFKQRDEPLAYSVGQYDINRPKIEKIYVPRFEKIEACYAEALASVNDARARQRIELFGDNMRFFYHELERAGYVGGGASSMFRMSDEEYSKFAHRPEPSGLPPAWYYMRRAAHLPPITR